MSHLIEDLISKEQFAEQIGVSPRTVANWVSSGKIAGVKVGRSYWLLKPTIERWLQERERLRVLPQRRRKRGRISS